MSTARFECAAAAVARGEEPVATASRVDRFVLVETEGPWGPRALPVARGLDDAVLRDVQQRAKAAHARTLLLRRPGRHACPPDARQVFAADCRPGRERLLTRTVTDAELAVLVLPFEDPTGWEPAETLVAVCTHGAHDLCCAVRGRPVAAALAAAYPELTWEVSHVGGDRFAANVLVLPGGHYLGQVTPEEAPAALAALLAGERPEPWYRGRSCWSMPVQAALALAARELGETRLDGLRPVRAETLAPARWRVELDRRGEAVEVEVRQAHGPASSRLTCHAADELPVPRWELVSVQSRTATS